MPITKFKYLVYESRQVIPELSLVLESRAICSFVIVDGELQRRMKKI